MATYPSNHLLTATDWLYLCIAVVTGLAWAVIYNYLIKFEYERHHNEWEKDGKPGSWYGSVPQGPLVKDLWNRWTLAFHWLWVTPEWASEKSSLSVLFLINKIFLVISIVSFFIAVAGIARIF